MGGDKSKTPSTFVVYQMNQALQGGLVTGPESLKHILKQVHRGLVCQSDNQGDKQYHKNQVPAVLPSKESQDQQIERPPGGLPADPPHDAIPGLIVPSVDGQK